jgi:hypothetical protein
MQPFNANAVCPKCAGVNVSARHRPAGPGFVVILFTGLTPEEKEFIETHESLLRTCERCKFMWIERCAPLDEVARAAADFDERVKSCVAEVLKKERALNRSGGETATPPDNDPPDIDPVAWAANLKANLEENLLLFARESKSRSLIALAEEYAELCKLQVSWGVCTPDALAVGRAAMYAWPRRTHP